METRIKSELDITNILNKFNSGDTDSLNQLFNVAYNNLHKIAERERKKIWGVDTISATALVNEAFIKLSNNSEITAENRAHFFAIAAKAMRQILLTYYEQKTAQKRGGDWKKISLEENNEPTSKFEDLLIIHDGIEKLQRYDPLLAQLVEMRFFGGMTEQDIALVFKCDARTVRRYWKKAKALLKSIMSPTRNPPPNSQDMNAIPEKAEN